MHSQFNGIEETGKKTEGMVRQGKRLTLGFFTDNITGQVGASAIEGIEEVCAAFGANLFIFHGKKIGSPGSSSPNFIYEMACRENIDGLIIWPSTLVFDMKDNESLNFYKKFLEIPVVTLGMNTPESFSVRIDNYYGVNKLMTHLIDFHGLEKIAFISATRGHGDSEERIVAYKRCLGEHGLEFDERLLSPYKDFSERTGRDAVDYFLKREGLVPGKDIQAILCPSDVIAAGAIRRLEALNYRVPKDIAVTGFNNTIVSRAIFPEITTIEIDFSDYGRKAAKLLIEKLTGKDVDKTVYIPSKEVIRHSCGCFEDFAITKDGNQNPKAKKYEENELTEELVAETGKSIKIREKENLQVLRDIIEAFAEDIRQMSHEKFLQVFVKAVAACTKRNNSLFELHSLLFMMRKKIVSKLEGEDKRFFAEGLLHHARIIIDSEFATLNVNLMDQLWMISNNLPSFSGFLNAMPDRGSVFDAFESILSRIGIKDCYIAFFKQEGGSGKRSSIRFVWRDGKREEIDNLNDFPSKNLIPEKYLHGKEIKNMVFYPISYNDFNFGIMAFDYTIAAKILFSSVAVIISTAMYNLKNG